VLPKLIEDLGRYEKENDLEDMEKRLVGHVISGLKDIIEH